MFSTSGDTTDARNGGCVVQFIEIGRRKAPRGVGRTAEGLAWLAAAGCRTPRAWVVPWGSLTSATDGELETALAKLLDPTATYRVSPSPDPPEEIAVDEIVDDCSRNTAPVRGAHGAQSVAAAIRRVRASCAPTVREALPGVPSPDQPVPRTSVLVQEEIPAVISGVSYSANPMTGAAEVHIEAVRGDPTALYSNATPGRWIRASGQWRLQPVASDMPTYVIAETAEKAEALDARNGWPVGIEWAWDGQHVTYTGMFELDTLDGVDSYTRRALQGLVPRIVTPLVWDITMPIVNGAIVRLMTEMVGETGIFAEDLSRCIYCRAYYDVGVLERICELVGLPRNTVGAFVARPDDMGDVLSKWRLTGRSIARAPRAMWFAATRVRLRAQVEREIPLIEKRLRAFEAGPSPTDLTASQVLDRVDELVPIVEDAAYLNTLSPIASAVYDYLFARMLPEFEIELDDVDLEADARVSTRLDARLQELHAAWAALPQGTRAAVTGGRVARVRATKSGAAFLGGVTEFLAEWGYETGVGVDLAVPSWSDDLPRTVRMIAAYERPVASPKVDRERLAEKGAGTSVLRAYDRAAAWHALRERSSALFARTYGALRPLYLRLGDILVRRGWLADADDIFLLTADELVAALAFERGEGTVRGTVVIRRAEVEAMRHAEVPEVLYGEVPAPVVSVEGDAVRGIAASAGYRAGRVVHLTHAAESSRVTRGDVVIVPELSGDWSDVLDRAGALVCESGGFLSPAARAARDTGIPAVVSVGDTSGIPEGAEVIVDGFAGTMARLLEIEAEREDTEAEDQEDPHERAAIS